MSLNIHSDLRQGTAAHSTGVERAAARRFYLLLSGLALAAMALIVSSTMHGVGIGGDATIYITSAQNLLAGRGLGLIEPDGEFRLLPYFAPFFSLALAFLGLMGADLATAARWLNILLYGGLVGLAGAATFRLTRSSLWGLLAALVLLVSPILIPVYSWAMSEPLALLLAFGGLWLAFTSLSRPGWSAAFFASAVLVGLSLATRYSSAAFVLAGALALLLFRPGNWLARLCAVTLWGAVAALPVLPWVVINLAQTETVSSRSLENGAGMLARLAGFWPQLFDAILSWLLPFSWIESPFYPAALNRLLPPVILLALLGWLVYAARRARRDEMDPAMRWALLLALAAGAYLALILLVYVTTYPPITIDNRMLSPVHVALVWLALILAARTRPNLRRLAAGLPLAVLLFAGWSYWRSARIVEQNAGLGLGYNSIEWRTSEVVQAVSYLSPETPIVTNEVTALMYLTGRSSYALQEIYRDEPAEAFTAFGASLDADEGERLFARGEAVLVLFDTVRAQLEPIYGERAAERADALARGLIVQYRGADGAIYTAGSGARP